MPKHYPPLTIVQWPFLSLINCRPAHHTSASRIFRPLGWYKQSDALTRLSKPPPAANDSHGRGLLWLVGTLIPHSQLAAPLESERFAPADPPTPTSRSRIQSIGGQPGLLGETPSPGGESPFSKQMSVLSISS